jgi:hypothetical protein
MLKKLIGLTTIVLLLVIAVSAQSQGPTPSTRKEIKPPQKQSASEQQKPETDKRGTEQTPFVVKTIPTPKSQAETDQERKEHQDKASQGWWVIWLTAFVAIATFLQALFLYFSLRETKKAANAAKDAAEVAETALHVAERAYLRIDGFEIVQFATGHHINICYEIHNVGHTPAQIIESLTIVDIVDKDSFKTPIYDIDKGIRGPKQSFIQPNEKASMIGISKEPVTPEGFISVQSNDKLIFAWGKITFQDVFGKTWINGFGAVFSQVFGLTMMDGYNYTKEYEPDKEQS